jgi:hypothetical protein
LITNVSVEFTAPVFGIAEYVRQTKGQKQAEESLLLAFGLLFVWLHLGP